MITEIARAKLNLALHVRARRPDGYHELETLFAFVEDGDVLQVEPADTDSFALTGPFAAALAGEADNLVTRAATRFREAFGGGGHAITLDKRLPVASGIGGGSADAGATLRALGRLHGVPLGEMFDIAAALGSDVPACLLGETAIGRGRGERLEPVPGLPGMPVLLVNPDVAVSTAEVFTRWDGIDRGPLTPDPMLGRNDLYAPARLVAPVIETVMAWLDAQKGVTLARMSGSGATCFALFDSKAARAAAAAGVPQGWWHLETRLV
ncbi:4-(cytidine 5'-diphospho)-2-C-methyl-D-erythritol kinase [Sphingomonas sp. JC676]|uniref:4-(cytidine 5'-diphospho)-2-C-methyl-D-erythritol kinase n=1 Tax=Sphingomonas sp. JC676 TaxID=2768065 RepID=UPI001657BBD1|nr:4-(cytidine 5'-diphospho)-2-C-methyl-D-erythritol kinase [Sphingomonas sp. JC676]MBC9031463.1 4-(cytidine 5'-diphospho)-2-C-methyl-D-erythritol kinase [Sphingomonas sp. JC676]